MSEPKRSNADTPEGKLLEPSTLTKAEALGLHARKVVEGAMAGRYKSPFTGFAIEFHQHREYVAGDDMRHMDWKVFGRTERYLIKQYEQETNFDGCVLLDGSKSMQYGSGETSKLDYGRIIAAVFSYLIVHERNSLTMSIFDTESRSMYPKTSNPRAMTNICKMLMDFEPAEQTKIGDVLHSFANQLKAAGITFVISDLFDDPEVILDGLRHLAFRKHEVVVFHVMDPYEIDFPFDGTVEFEGLEVAEKLTLQPHAIRKSYQEEVQKFLRQIRNGCEQFDINYILCNTAEPVGEVLNRYLATRLRVTGRY
ncbi:DUF58 domain-containing protein [Cerasicoccus arenae]|uniref:DUF58 domain-containing protein n=1 Tax=Cerasicoccus arenae TaxID=424488 RepID=UPI001906B62B|nr:DUF58 domain-containing protein [Cerasicoccus arenae]MBK1859953.1 DUF58 domain-containing protein [Cerasicoccus arenae]